MAKDLVCLMQIDEKAAAGTFEHEGTAYDFCSANCRDAFKKNPGKYVKGDKA